jgi:acetyl/propionyl-CoA carboxylase alpha subunit
MKRLLIANRGEIALRVMRTARRMGIETVAVYSDADADAPHVQYADFTERLGPASVRESYLNQQAVLEAIKRSGADAVHPGYGFLSENAGFADALAEMGVVFVGPPASSIRAMGLKDAAKQLMRTAGVPVTPGYDGDDQTDTRLQTEADAIGYPVLIKAVAGGGGKGMRKVDDAASFITALHAARREGESAFGDARVLIEKYILNPRHIEVQVFADTFGNTVHLYERDCSLQRRHQKVIEEAPAPGMSADVRAAVCAAAVAAAKAVNYVGAGTIEFIADGSGPLDANRIWFMEMNTRLQVEHPVTESITGQDLVEWQLRVARGEALPLAQADIPMIGHAVEARLYAENPHTGFLPAIGTLQVLHLPDDQIRVDSGVEEGGAITPNYDPMIAKLIAYGETRDAAIETLSDAIAATCVGGVKTNAAFLKHCLDHPDFRAARIDTGFIARHMDVLVPSPDLPHALAALAVAYKISERLDVLDATGDAWARLDGFRINALPRRAEHFVVDGQRFDVTLTGRTFDINGTQLAGGNLTGDAHTGVWRLGVGGELAEAHVVLSGDTIHLFRDGAAWMLTPQTFVAGAAAAGDGAILAPMPGKILDVKVKQGDTVLKGADLMILEAMKMEHALTAPFDGVVEELSAITGAQTAEGVVLAKLVAV